MPRTRSRSCLALLLGLVGVVAIGIGILFKPLKGMLAGWTGLEPATSDVTGRRSNQLNYHPARVAPGPFWRESWWAVQDSNL